MRLHLPLIPLVALAALAISVREVHSQSRPPPVPPGTTWWCQPATADSVCFRDEEACKANLRVGVDCYEQKKAAAMTFYSVMDDDWILLVMSSMAECKAAKRSVERQRDDFRRASQCKIVGAVAYPRQGSFELAAVEAGPGWACPSKPDAGYCMRTAFRCVETLAKGSGAECKQAGEAFIFTYRELSTMAFQAVASSTAKECELERRQHLRDKAVAQVSACQPLP